MERGNSWEFSFVRPSIHKGISIRVSQQSGQEFARGSTCQWRLLRCEFFSWIHQAYGNTKHINLLTENCTMRFFVWFASFDEERKCSSDVAENNEGRRQGWAIKIFVNQVIAVETPHLFRVLLHSLKCVAARKYESSKKDSWVVSHFSFHFFLPFLVCAYFLNSGRSFQREVAAFRTQPNFANETHSLSNPRFIFTWKLIRSVRAQVLTQAGRSRKERETLGNRNTVCAVRVRKKAFPWQDERFAKMWSSVGIALIATFRTDTCATLSCCVDGGIKMWNRTWT